MTGRPQAEVEQAKVEDADHPRDAKTAWSFAPVPNYYDVPPEESP